MTFSEIENNKVCYTYTDLSKPWEFNEKFLCYKLKLNYLTRRAREKMIQSKVEPVPESLLQTNEELSNLYSSGTKIFDGASEIFMETNTFPRIF